MKNALVIGGNSGLGLAIVLEMLKKYEKIYVIGKNDLSMEDIPKDVIPIFEKKVIYIKNNLINCEYDFLNECQDIDTLIITCGFGRVAPFEDLTIAEINNMIKVNEVAIINIVKHYYNQLLSDNNFYCAIISSIAGIVSSPLFSVYSATKGAIHKFIESINIELMVKGSSNRILEVAPGSLKGTKFNGGNNSLELLENIPNEILNKMLKREFIYIPNYDKTYKEVIERYNNDGIIFGENSYQYKINRISTDSKVKIGYLSGTFDLFHIGHLNILKRAKQYCDYLIVGLHKDGSWKGKETFIPFDERKKILESVKYVDKVVLSEPEDNMAWEKYHYNYLFVGSDYKNSERFNKYEEYFKDKDVEIIYFPYTKSTSSTQLRAKIKQDKE